MPQDPTTLAQRAQVDPRSGQRRCWAHACRDGEVMCGRVTLTIGVDTRLGLAPRERRRVGIRFIEHVHPELRQELSELIRRRGAAARRAAERMKPIELVFDAPPDGIQRITGWLEPPCRKRGELNEIEFNLHELT